MVRGNWGQIPIISLTRDFPAMIFVTGGAGYIGSHTCVELLNAGHEVKRSSQNFSQ
jgi:NADP-dependent 3-hydroxy acid dehydrogenase YdfG